jgi:quinol monooxygenase YgiN
VVIILVEVQINPEKREEFLAAIKENAISCEADEEGCSRFDILQDKANEDTYYYYEVYRDEAAVQAHRETPHFQKYRDQARDLTVKTTAHTLVSIHPTDASWR